MAMKLKFYVLMKPPILSENIKKSWSTIMHVNGQLLQPFAAAAAANHPFNCINLYSDALPDRWNLQTNNNNRSKRW